MNLVPVVHDQGKFQRAEAVQLDKIAAREEETGAKNQTVLKCTSACVNT